MIDHPLIQHKLAIIRDLNTGAKEFRELVEEVAMLMAYEVTRNFPLDEVEVETPVAMGPLPDNFRQKDSCNSNFKSGVGNNEGILKLILTAKVGHIGIYQ